jgi:hypothetical protein|tara:strand:- start:351 stop:566 length:216 start_codon:yes stop_codon:yes gene_type:complete
MNKKSPSNYPLEVTFSVKYKVKIGRFSEDINSDAEYLAKRMFFDDYKIDAHIDDHWIIQVEDDLDEVGVDE